MKSKDLSFLKRRKFTIITLNSLRLSLQIPYLLVLKTHIHIHTDRKRERERARN